MAKVRRPMPDRSLSIRSGSRGLASVVSTMIGSAPLAHSLAYTYNSSSNMGLFEERLLLIESRLQVFVEGAADRLFPGRGYPSGWRRG